MKQLALLGLVSVLTFGCGNEVKESGNESDKSVPVDRMDLTKDEMKTQIDDLTKVLMSQEVLKPNQREAFEIVALYKAYADKFRDDPETVECLFKAGEISTGIGQYFQAISFFERLAKEYPEAEKAGESLFLIAFTYHEHLKDMEKAKHSYERVIAVYPENYWAGQATAMLSMLDVSDEEMIRRFEEKLNSEKSPS